MIYHSPATLFTTQCLSFCTVSLNLLSLHHLSTQLRMCSSVCAMKQCVLVIRSRVLILSKEGSNLSWQGTLLGVTHTDTLRAALFFCPMSRTGRKQANSSALATGSGTARPCVPACCSVSFHLTASDGAQPGTYLLKYQYLSVELPLAIVAHPPVKIFLRQQGMKAARTHHKYLGICLIFESH